MRKPNLASEPGKLDLIVGPEERNGRDQNWSTKHHKVWVYLRR